jgi:tetratricopeptide (TPR) repeat protein
LFNLKIANKLDFFKRIFNKENSSTPMEQNSRNSKNEFDTLWIKLNENKYAEVINEATKFIQSDKKSIKNEALKLIGLSYFRNGQYNLSEQTFETLTETSSSPEDWFNLVTSSTLNKNIELSEKAYKKTLELYKEKGTKENIPIPQIYFYYMQGLRDVKEYSKAFQQLEKLTDIYAKLVITDDTFVYMRGVPFLSHTLEASKEILESIDIEKAKKLISDLMSKVDEEGKDYLMKFEKTINYKSN